MAVAEAETQRASRKRSPNGRPLTRDEAAERIKQILIDNPEPQSAAALRRALGVPAGTRGRGGDIVTDGLGVLEARGEIKRIPNTAGSKLGGWVLITSELAEADVPIASIEFPYEWSVLNVDEMFIDPDYQRPLTNFVDKIRRGFDPLLFQVLAVNLRDKPNKDGKRLAIIDGQTRWTGARRRVPKVQMVPCIQFIGLTPEQEADIFVRLQKERRGHVSVHRFRAEVKAKRPDALALLKLVKAAGWGIGEKPGEIRAVSTLESCFKRDQYLLERTLVMLKGTFPDRMPEDALIRGLHFFYMHYPLNQRRRLDINDDKLTKKLKTTGIDALKRKMLAGKELSNKSNGRLMAEAIESVYQSR